MIFGRRVSIKIWVISLFHKCFYWCTTYVMLGCFSHSGANMGRFGEKSKFPIGFDSAQSSEFLLRNYGL